uniref:hypothetical protein n=1 Tax=uncultured Fibrobacter sp. TaxID=261512 RepID=UPI0028063739
MGLAHEKKSYLQEKANLFEIGSYKKIFFCHFPLDNMEKSFIIKNKQWRTCAFIKIFGVEMTVAEQIALK